MAKFFVINLEKIAHNPHLDLIKEIIDKHEDYTEVKTDIDTFEVFWMLSEEDIELMKMVLGPDIYELLERYAGLEIR